MMRLYEIKYQKGASWNRWDSVVEKVRKHIGGNREEILSIEKFAGYKTEIKERNAKRRRLADKKQSEGGTL